MNKMTSDVRGTTKKVQLTISGGCQYSSKFGWKKRFLLKKSSLFPQCVYLVMVVQINKSKHENVTEKKKIKLPTYFVNTLCVKAFNFVSLLIPNMCIRAGRSR